MTRYVVNKETGTRIRVYEGRDMWKTEVLLEAEFGDKTIVDMIMRDLRRGAARKESPWYRIEEGW